MRIWSLTAMITPLVAIAISVLIRLMISVPDMPVFFMLLFSMVTFLLIFALYAFIFSPSIIHLVRYYKNLFSDEGMLTFLLPVKRSTILISKLLSYLIYTFASGAVIFADILLITLIIPNPETGSGCLISFLISELFSGIWVSFSAIGFWLVLFVLLGILLIVASTVLSAVFMQYVVTFACQMTKKLKILMIFLAIYLFETVMVVAVYILMFMLIMAMDFISTATMDISTNAGCGIITLVILTLIGFSTAMASLLFRSNVNRLEKRLNL